VSTALEVRIDHVAPNVPTYRLVLTNRSPQAVVAIQYEAYRGAVRLLSERRKTDRNEALVPPGRNHAFEIQRDAASGSAERAGQAVTLDRVAITSVLWADGRVDGDPGLLADERMIDLGKAAQIRHVLQVIRDVAGGASEPSERDFRAAVTALPVGADLLRTAGSRTGMQQVKDAVLRDLDAFDRALSQRGATSFALWLSDATASYEEWLARIVALR
jgi:hypothetical protein